MSGGPPFAVTLPSQRRDRGSSNPFPSLVNLRQLFPREPIIEGVVIGSDKHPVHCEPIFGF